jgi:hypothetical protein
MDKTLFLDFVVYATLFIDSDNFTEIYKITIQWKEIRRFLI